MNKFLKSLLLFFLAFDLSSNASIEITTIEVQDSYNTTQRFPGKILPLNYSELAFEIFKLYIDDIPELDLRKIVDKSYSNFSDPKVTPLVEVDGDYILELFHGPTLAFKDIALQFLGNVFEHILCCPIVLFFTSMRCQLPNAPIPMVIRCFKKNIS